MKSIKIGKNTKWWNVYPNILFTKIKKGAIQLPIIEIVQQDISLDKKAIEKYHTLCGIKQDDFVSATYLHVLSMPCHLSLLTNNETGLALFGLIHLSNTIKQYRKIKISEKIDIKCCFGRLFAHEKGQAIELKTAIYIQQELVWESTTIFLKKGKKGQGEEYISNQLELSSDFTTTKWTYPYLLGTQYAMISGDFNPIHLFPLSAKLLGMPRHLIHGMYTKAKILGDLMKTNDLEKFEISVFFKLPIFLPAVIIYRKNTIGDTIIFDVMDLQMEKPHIKGFLKTF